MQFAGVEWSTGGVASLYTCANVHCGVGEPTSDLYLLKSMMANGSDLQ